MQAVGAPRAAPRATRACRQRALYRAPGHQRRAQEKLHRTARRLARWAQENPGNQWSTVRSGSVQRTLYLKSTLLVAQTTRDLTFVHGIRCSKIRPGLAGILPLRCAVSKALGAHVHPPEFWSKVMSLRWRSVCAVPFCALCALLLQGLPDRRPPGSAAPDYQNRLHRGRRWWRRSMERGTKLQFTATAFDSHRKSRFGSFRLAKLQRGGRQLRPGTRC